MLKSIKSSPEQEIVTQSEIKRDFNSVLSDIPKMNRAINRIEKNMTILDQNM